MSVLARGGVRDGRLVSRIAGLVAVSRSLPNILDRVVATLAEHGYPGSGITLINERDELYVVAYDGPPDEAVLSLRLPVGEGIMGGVAAEGRPILIKDLDDPRGPTPANRQVGGHARMRSMLAVPIVTEHTVIGVLEVDSTEPGRFGPQDQAVFEAVASEIAEAVHMAAPVELAGALLRRRVQEVLVLEETTRALAAVHDVDAAFRTAARYAALGLSSPRVVMLRLDGDVATVVAAFGSADGAQAAGSEAAPGEETLVAPGLAEAVANGAAFVNLASAAERLGFPAAGNGRAIAAAAVHAGEEFSGALVVASRASRGFDPAELRLLEGIADLAGLAISNADRYRRLVVAADTDSVTGLHNRARFERDLAAHNGSALAVLSIDLDRLKHTNDTYGHEAGDAVLEHVGEAIDKIVGGRGPLARTGADEFAVLLPGANTTEALAIAEDLRASMYGLVPPYGTARVSIGVAAGLGGSDARAIWSAADAALARAKAWGRDRVVSAGYAVPPAQVWSTGWDEQLANLINTRSLESVYQPVVRLDDHDVVAYEALARPAGAAPDLNVEGLFSSAHRTGWSRELDWLARRVAVQGAGALPQDKPLFINCSVGALLNPVHDVDQMLLLLNWAGQPAGHIVLEITEREAFDDVSHFRDVLASYRSYGFRFAIDDVGEGRSTLEVLAAAEPEFVKVARGLTASSQLLGPRSALRAIIAFARSSGATIIAEGIETEREAAVMSEMDIQLGQGWWLGRPARVGTADAQ
jgi:diguanylate cyclase (GGDEF)-like protein